MSDTGIAAVERYLAEAAKASAKAAEAQAKADAIAAEQAEAKQEAQRRFDEQVIADYAPEHAERLRDEAMENLYDAVRREPWFAALVEAQAAAVRPNRAANRVVNAHARLGNHQSGIFEPAQREVIFPTVLSQLVSHDAAAINNAEAEELEQRRNQAT